MKYCTIILVAACIAVFAMQNIANITDDFVLVSSDVIQRPWTLVTAIFLHADLSHLAYNMFALLLFGSILENIIGSRRFIIVFFLSGITASIAALFFYDSVLGASGAIFGIMGALAAIRPSMIVWVMGVPMPMIIAAAVWASLDLLGFFSPTNIANASHLAGLISGLLVGLALRKKSVNAAMKKDHIMSEKEMEEWERDYLR